MAASWNHQETNPIVDRVIHKAHANTGDWVTVATVRSGFLEDEEGKRHVDYVVAHTGYSPEAAASHIVAGWDRGFDGGRGSPRNEFRSTFERSGHGEAAKYRPKS
jgi:hypothetical protein